MALSAAGEERQERACEAEENRRTGQVQARRATLERLIDNAPATPNAAQFRVLLRAIVNLDTYTFADDLAEETTAEDPGNDDRSAEQTLLDALDSTVDEKLTGFAIRLALSGHASIPRDGETDFLTEAHAAFTQPERQKEGKPRLVKAAAKKTATKKAPVDCIFKNRDQQFHAGTVMFVDDDPVALQRCRSLNDQAFAVLALIFPRAVRLAKSPLPNRPYPNLKDGAASAR